jgi:hypothetical protein
MFFGYRPNFLQSQIRRILKKIFENASDRGAAKVLITATFLPFMPKNILGETIPAMWTKMAQ